MAEPTGLTAAVIWACIVGSVAAFFTAIRVDPPIFVFALLGAYLGQPIGEGIGRGKALVSLACASLLAAKCGFLASLRWFGGDPDYAAVFAAMGGVASYKVIAAFLVALPGFMEPIFTGIRRMLVKVTGGPEEPVKKVRK